MCVCWGGGGGGVRPNYFIIIGYFKMGAWRGVRANRLNPLWIRHWIIIEEYSRHSAYPGFKLHLNLQQMKFWHKNPLLVKCQLSDITLLALKWRKMSLVFFCYSSEIFLVLNLFYRRGPIDLPAGVWTPSLSLPSPLWICPWL